jgi:hypothetical protein
MTDPRHSRISPLPGGCGAVVTARIAPDTRSSAHAMANKRKERPSNYTDWSQ